MSIVQWLESQITNAAVTGALLVSLAFLLRTTIAERVRRAVGHEYDAKLEEMRASNAKVLDELRSARAEREAFRAMVMSLMSSTRTSTLDRRVNAIEILWNALQSFRTGMPYIIGTLDLVGWRIDKLGSQGLLALTQTKYLEALTPTMKLHTEVTKCRPFLGDQLYSLYHATQAIFGQAVSTTLVSYQQKSFRLWFDEPEISELLKTILNSDELKRFHALNSGKLDWLFRALEAKIVTAIQKELSGVPDAEQVLVQAVRIMERVAALNRASPEFAANA